MADKADIGEDAVFKSCGLMILHHVVCCSMLGMFGVCGCNDGVKCGVVRCSSLSAFISFWSSSLKERN